MTSGQRATAEIRAVIAELVEAWRRHDADAYGALFTEDATYVTFVGTHYQGRRDITESHRTLFAKYLKGTELADELVDVRLLTPDVAVATSRGDTYKGRKGQRPKKLSKVQTYTLIRTEQGSWRVAAFQNTKRKPLMEAISFRTAPGLVPSSDTPARQR